MPDDECGLTFTRRCGYVPYRANAIAPGNVAARFASEITTQDAVVLGRSTRTNDLRGRCDGMPRVPQGRVRAVGRHQLVVRAEFRHHASVHHGDPVGVVRGMQPVRDRDDGTVSS
jgi:hypothetical protein